LPTKLITIREQEISIADIDSYKKRRDFIFSNLQKKKREKESLADRPKKLFQRLAILYYIFKICQTGVAPLQFIVCILFW